MHAVEMDDLQRFSHSDFNFETDANQRWGIADEYEK
jgi:hypothetical protein